MKRFLIAGGALALACAGLAEWRQPEVIAQQAPAERAATVVNAPEIPWDSNTQFLKYSPDMNLGEVLGVAVNSKGRIAVLESPREFHLRAGLRQCLDAAIGVRSFRQVHSRGREGCVRARLWPRPALRPP